MGVKDIDDFGDSLLIVQQVKGEFQCLDGLLNSYLDRCLDIIRSLDTFTISHIPREENSRANVLAQQASGYHINRGKFFILERPMLVASKDETEIEKLGNDYRVIGNSKTGTESQQLGKAYRVADNSETFAESQQLGDVRRVMADSEVVPQVEGECERSSPLAD